MTSKASGNIVDMLARTAQDVPGLELLLLFGSRARESRTAGLIATSFALRAVNRCKVDARIS